MKSTFFSRFAWFTPAFYAGCVLTVLILTVVKTVVYFHSDFWPWLLSWLKGDVFPVALAELFRSPIMGLLFAAVGPRRRAKNWIGRFGFFCGACSYLAADMIALLTSRGGVFLDTVGGSDWITPFLLGLPLVLVLLSRAFPAERQIN